MSGVQGQVIAMGEERVSFVPDDSKRDKFIPRIEGSGGAVRPFELEDIGRLMDYDGLESGSANVGGSDPVTEGGLMLCEYNESGPHFLKYYFFLRGGFLFYFDHEDIEDNGDYATYTGKPTGIIPLDNVEVEYPPGGRRVFREHAMTDARTGYEFAIAHVPEEKDGEETAQRPPFFLVADSLGRRERWAKGLRLRAEVAVQPTLLRAGYTKISTAGKSDKSDEKANPTSDSDAESDDSEKEEESDNDDEPVPVLLNNETKSLFKFTSAKSAKAVEKKGVTLSEPTLKRASQESNFGRAGRGSGALRKRAESKAKMLKSREEDVKNVREHITDAANDEGLAKAVVEFGVTEFDEQDWIDQYFEVHNDFDAPSKLREMEEWQTLMKKNLKGAVLEQYEYFVQASGQMTTMGKEVHSLKTLIETQLEIIREMKEVDFASSMNGNTDGRDEIMGRDDSEKPDAIKYRSSSRNKSIVSDDRSAISELSDNEKNPKDADDIEDDPNAPPIEVPDWLSETTGEIAAFVRECRYNDSIDLLLKAKAEIAELFDKHERPTAYRLRKAQVLKLREFSKELDSLTIRISNRLEEALRRKNEALRQSAKRERADSHAAAATMISPCAISDDTLYLQLLVRLGRNHQAAEAYSARRTLLLLETLHERPISGSGSVDLVIYAAQISQSFFSVLASSVEGFLDLFLSPKAVSGDNGDENMSTGDASSIHSNNNNSKSLPSGAIAAVVLWCDGELSKFAAAFGGTRILANLALSPPPTASLMEQRIQPRVVGQDSDVGKERQNAIQVAAQCLDQAFQHASSNLDAVGLPLTPRLAEYIRVRLKGCEAEVAALLDERWHGFTNEWRSSNENSNAALNMMSVGVF